MCEVTQIIAVFMVLSLPIGEPACFYVFFFSLLVFFRSFTVFIQS